MDLKPFEINTYKKRGWALRDQEVGRQRSADAKEVEEAKQAESFQQKYCTVPFRLGFCSPGRVAYNLVDVGFRIYPGTWLAALVLAATAGLAAQAHNPLQNFARTSPTYVAPEQSAPAQSAPGPKGKIIAINATGSRRYPSGQIAAVSGLRVGDAAGREELQAAADRLAQLGPFATSGYRFSSRGEDITVEFKVEDAPAVPVSFDNFPWFTDAELTDALKQGVTLFDGTAPEQGSILDAMTEALQKLVASHGIQGTVERALMAEPGGDRMVQQFSVAGANLQIEAVKLGDALATDSKRVRDRVSDLVGKSFSRFAIEVFCVEQVRPVYLERGHLRVQIGKPKAGFTGDPNRPLPSSVLVQIPIEPGPAYLWGGVEWRGNAAFGPAALNEFLSLKTGELADGLKIAGAWERVRDEYGRRGYLDVKLEPQPVFDDAAKRVSYSVTIAEGPTYRMGELVITGLSLAAERKLTEAWRMPRGQVFDRLYFDEFLATGIKQTFADYVIHPERPGHWLRTHPETGTVDVLLDFK